MSKVSCCSTPNTSILNRVYRPLVSCPHPLPTHSLLFSLPPTQPQAHLFMFPLVSVPLAIPSAGPPHSGPGNHLGHSYSFFRPEAKHHFLRNISQAPRAAAFLYYSVLGSSRSAQLVVIPRVIIRSLSAPSARKLHGGQPAPAVHTTS